MVDDGDGNGERESRMEKRSGPDLLYETADDQESRSRRDGRRRV